MRDKDLSKLVLLTLLASEIFLVLSLFSGSGPAILVSGIALLFSIVGFIFERFGGMK